MARGRKVEPKLERVVNAKLRIDKIIKKETKELSIGYYETTFPHNKFQLEMTAPTEMAKYIA